ncbi:hypothetical protein C8J56DRAFT_290095 [Mycena floridula]|nr:hypothetical protein C8J56DRAFT_290095 [Mycena floridula]
MIFAVAVALLALFSGAWAVHLVPRGAQTTASCSADFLWANNALGNNPCLVAAYLIGACHSDNWLVPAMTTGGTKYDIPPDACSCSWATYNTLSACAACQGQSGAIQTWATIKTSTNCSSFASAATTYFPPDTPIEGGITIPFWAGTAPTTWNNGIFNTAQAQVLANEKKPDLNPDVSKKKSQPIGAIVGGVVGSIVVLGVGALIFWHMHRRKAQLNPHPPTTIQVAHRPIIHGRSISDLSSKSATTYISHGIHSTYPTSPTIQSHSTGPGSIFGSIQGSIYSAPPPVRVVSPPLNREDVIEPFMTGPRAIPPLNRKASSDTSIQPVNRVQTIPEESSAASPGRRRVNPPAYTPSASQTDLGSQPASRGHRPGRGDKGSQDTQTSWDSYGSRSMADAAGAANSIGFHIPRRSTNTTSPAQHSRQTSGATGAAEDNLPVA